MGKVTFNGLWARKRRLIGTFLAVFIGVAFLSGTLVLGDTLSDNFDALFSSVTIAKSLGEPSASIVPLSGVNMEVVLTVAWDISWYQYRITPESGQPVRLEERGHDPRELEPKFTSWNARLTPDGRIVPDISPV